MPTLPTDFVHRREELFGRLFSKRTWRWVPLLVAGTRLATGRRPVTAALRVLGLAENPSFRRFHGVLNRAVWSPREAGHRVLLALVKAFVPSGPVVLGLDDSIERRWGPRMGARGIYRDPVRSSRGHFVKTSGLRWLSLMLLTPIPWAGRVWALPFLTALCPSERYYAQRSRRHKTLTDWARQLLLQVSRWLPGRTLVVVADSRFAALELLEAVRQRLIVVTRLRLDAALYAPPPPRRPGQAGRPRRKGKRLQGLQERLVDSDTAWQIMAVARWYGEGERQVEWASGTAVGYHGGLPAVPIRWLLVRDPGGRFEPQGFLCTDPAVAPEQMLDWLIQRWQVEVTFEEVRLHLGVETQRQGSDPAIARTTPPLLGLYSIVTLLAQERWTQETLSTRGAAWYRKRQPTFSDALASIRRWLWSHPNYSTSSEGTAMVTIPQALFERLTDAVCYGT